MQDLRQKVAEKRGEKVSQMRVAHATKLDVKTISLLKLGKVDSITPRVAKALARYYSKALGRTIKPDALGYPLTYQVKRRRR